MLPGDLLGCQPRVGGRLLAFQNVVGQARPIVADDMVGLPRPRLALIIRVDVVPLGGCQVDGVHLVDERVAARGDRVARPAGQIGFDFRAAEIAVEVQGS